ncbi:hypothetical protein BGZ97_012041, partial [Linnemannia gamsii]
MEEQQLISLVGRILAKSLREEINKLVDARLADSNVKSLAPTLTTPCCDHKCSAVTIPHSMPRRGHSPEHVKEMCTNITQKTPISLASHSSYDLGINTLQKAKGLPCFETNYHNDRQYCHNNDHNHNEWSSNETDSDEEKGHMHNVITNHGSAPHQLDTTGTATASLARDASSSIVDLSSTKSNCNIYNHPSGYEFPNGNIVEAIQLLPSDQDSRSKSTGWALLPLQSFKAVVRKNCNVKKKRLDYHIDSDNEERVDIAEKICL